MRPASNLADATRRKSCLTVFLVLDSCFLYYVATDEGAIS